MKAGDKFALVGINGAGKSTIVRLILGFYVPDTGSVKINGIDTRDLDLDDAYHHISSMFQDSAILSYTIMENVSMNDIAKSDRDNVCDCLKRVGLWEYVDHLPNKELTYLYNILMNQVCNYQEVRYRNYYWLKPYIKMLDVYY